MAKEQLSLRERIERVEQVCVVLMNVSPRDQPRILLAAAELMGIEIMTGKGRKCEVEE